MVNEKILNSFLSTNLRSLGLQHVNSEVPKIVSDHVGKRMDIFAYDLESAIPIILELKAKKDPNVISQIGEYISFISNRYPKLFEELNAFRRLDGFSFNYKLGIVGIVLSPEPPPSQTISDFGCLILWVQYSFLNDSAFRLLGRRVLSNSSGLASSFANVSSLRRRPASEFVASTLPKSRQFVDRLDELFLSVAPAINLREKFDHNYIAYYATDTSRVLFGFNTGGGRSDLHVEFSVYKKNQPEFRACTAIKKLGLVGLKIDRIKKDQIFGIKIDEQFAGNESKVIQALNLFKEMANTCYGFATISQLETLHLDPISTNGLSLKSFGLNSGNLLI